MPFTITATGMLHPCKPAGRSKLRRSASRRTLAALRPAAKTSMNRSGVWPSPVTFIDAFPVTADGIPDQPGPQPRWFAVYIPTAAGVRRISVPALRPFLETAYRVAFPDSFMSGIVARIWSVVESSTFACHVRLGVSTSTVVSPGEKRSPSIEITAPGASAPPGTAMGKRLASLTTPPCLIHGGAVTHLRRKTDCTEPIQGGTHCPIITAGSKNCLAPAALKKRFARRCTMVGNAAKGAA